MFINLSESVYHINEFKLFPFTDKSNDKSLTEHYMYLTRYIFLASCKDENGEMILSLLHVKKIIKHVVTF